MARTPTLTRQAPVANTAGTQPVQTEVVDNSIAQGLGDIVKTTDVHFQRKARDAAQTEVENLLQAENVDTVPNTIGAIIDETSASVEGEVKGEMEKHDELVQAERQGVITKERLINELQVTAKKLNARFPGYQDIIMREIQKRTGINPNTAALQLSLSQGNEEAYQEQALFNEALEYNALIYNQPGVFSSGMNADATALKLAERKLKAANSAALAKSAKGTTKEELEDAFHASHRAYLEDDVALDFLRQSMDVMRQVRPGDPISDITYLNLAANAQALEIRYATEHFQKLESQGTKLPRDWPEIVRKEAKARWAEFGKLDDVPLNTLPFEVAEKLMQGFASVEGFINMPFVTRMMKSMGPDAAMVFANTIFQGDVLSELQFKSGDEIIAAVNDPSYDQYRTFTSATDRWYAFRNAMLVTMFPQQGDMTNAGVDLGPLMDNMTPDLKDLTVQRTFQIVDSLGSKVLNSPNDRHIWGSGIVTMAEQHYKKYLNDSSNNLVLLQKRMSTATFQKNLDALKSDGQDYGYETINAFRGLVFRDYFNSRMRKANGFMPGNEPAIVIEDGVFKLTPKAERSSPSEKIRRIAQDLQRLVDKSAVLGIDTNFVQGAVNTDTSETSDDRQLFNLLGSDAPNTRTLSQSPNAPVGSFTHKGETPSTHQGETPRDFRLAVPDLPDSVQEFTTPQVRKLAKSIIKSQKSMEVVYENMQAFTAEQVAVLANELLKARDQLVDYGSAVIEFFEHWLERSTSMDIMTSEQRDADLRRFSDLELPEQEFVLKELTKVKDFGPSGDVVDETLETARARIDKRRGIIHRGETPGLDKPVFKDGGR